MMTTNPIVYQNAGAKAAIVFTHGFTGEMLETWQGFPELLTQDTELSGYNFYFWGYPTALKLHYALTKYFWEDDPNLDTLGRGLRTLLDHTVEPYDKLVLVGHSMGGLVIQAFILEEIRKGKPSTHLDRLTEVILYGTPSGGLQKAGWGAFFKNQLADMDDGGPFIATLGRGWQELIDDSRSDANRAAQFRLTLVAGMKDTFVPQEAALRPFPLDEQEICPGNHTEMVKPAVVGTIPYLILKKRLLRPGLTALQRKLLLGESDVVIQYINRIRAAVDLGETQELTALATELLHQPDALMPHVDRALGLALVDHEQYQEAAALLTRYLDFQMPGEGTHPFRFDVPAVHQLAVALSEAGNIHAALTRLEGLDPHVRDLSDTIGIRAGRIKRQWLKYPVPTVGQRALNLYETAFRAAQVAPDSLGQALFNGINTAYMAFALGKPSYVNLSTEVLNLCQMQPHPDYWTDVTRAEAHLLLRNYLEAVQAYEKALNHAPAPRYLSTSARQALDIIQRQGNPPEAQVVTGLIAHYFQFTQNHKDDPEDL
jgi:pimeloyl-ACP methyl ester carboxylesterase/tetratricopeptide (TPR) repeat protein